MKTHLLRSISRRQSEWMVCPHGSTAVGLTLSNRYSKHTGQFWRMLFSTQTWLPCATQSHAWRLCTLLLRFCIRTFPGFIGTRAHSQRSVRRKQRHIGEPQPSQNTYRELCPP